MIVTLIANVASNRLMRSIVTMLNYHGHYLVVLNVPVVSTLSAVVLAALVVVESVLVGLFLVMTRPSMLLLTNWVT
jgi:hypothetical protein